MKIISGRVKKPFNVLLYGQPGSGKSTWASKSPNPIFIASDELDELDIDRLPKVKSQSEVEAQLDWLLKEKHDYKTLVVDTIDEIEKIIHQEILNEEKSDKTRSMNKAKGGYGNAYAVALDRTTQIKNKMERLRNEKGMNLITLCHSTTRVTNDPLLGDSYTEWYLSLHDKVQSLFVDWVSCVLFLAFDVTKSENDKFAYGSGERYIYTQKKPGFEAKNRYHLDPVLECSEGSPFKSFWKGYSDYFNVTGEQPEKIITSIIAMLDNVKDEAVVKKIHASVEKYKSDSKRLLKVKEKVTELIGG